MKVTEAEYMYDALLVLAAYSALPGRDGPSARALKST